MMIQLRTLLQVEHLKVALMETLTAVSSCQAIHFPNGLREKADTPTSAWFILGKQE